VITPQNYRSMGPLSAALIKTAESPVTQAHGVYRERL
jgi:hypothetical protein